MTKFLTETLVDSTVFVCDAARQVIEQARVYAGHDERLLLVEGVTHA